MTLINQFLLDKKITFLNHGSFGACPKPVFDEYQNWQIELEKSPVEFMLDKALHFLKESRASLNLSICL